MAPIQQQLVSLLLLAAISVTPRAKAASGWSFQGLTNKTQAVIQATGDPVLKALANDNLSVDHFNQLVAMFDDWTRYYNYKFTASESVTAFSHFKSNMKHVFMVNKNQSIPFWLSGNQYSHLPSESFQSESLGKKPDPAPGNTSSQASGSRRATRGLGAAAARKLLKDLPAAWDWRTAGKVTPVKNQGLCGSCWAYAATAAIESTYLIFASDSSAPLVDLSEQELLQCCDNTTGCKVSHGCDGGYVDEAMTFVASVGQVPEALYLDTSVSAASSDPLDPSTVGACNHALMGSTARVQLLGRPMQVPAQSEIALRQAVVSAPTTIYFEVRGSFQFYAGGLYTGEDCRTATNHAMVVVGYNTTASPSYWIVRNSFGEGWGEQGYIRLPMTGEGSDGICGMYLSSFQPPQDFSRLGAFPPAPPPMPPTPPPPAAPPPPAVPLAPPAVTPPSTNGACSRAYSVQSGDTCSNIALAQNTTVNNILTLNPAVNSACTNLQLGQSLCLESAGPSSSRNCSQSYTVKSGDICYDIAQSHNTTVANIVALNPGVKSDCSFLQVGQSLCLAAGSSASNGSATTTIITNTSATPPAYSWVASTNSYPPPNHYCPNCRVCQCNNNGTGYDSCGDLCCPASPTPSDGSNPCWIPCPNTTKSVGGPSGWQQCVTPENYTWVASSNSYPPPDHYCPNCRGCRCNNSKTGYDSCGDLCCPTSPTPSNGSNPCWIPCPNGTRSTGGPYGWQQCVTSLPDVQPADPQAYTWVASANSYPPPDHYCPDCRSCQCNNGDTNGTGYDSCGDLCCLASPTPSDGSDPCWIPCPNGTKSIGGPFGWHQCVTPPQNYTWIPSSNSYPPPNHYCPDCRGCQCNNNGTGYDSCGSLCCPTSPTPSDGSNACWKPCPNGTASVGGPFGWQQCISPPDN